MGLPFHVSPCPAFWTIGPRLHPCNTARLLLTNMLALALQVGPTSVKSTTVHIVSSPSISTGRRGDTRALHCSSCWRHWYIPAWHADQASSLLRGLLLLLMGSAAVWLDSCLVMLKVQVPLRVCVRPSTNNEPWTSLWPTCTAGGAVQGTDTRCGLSLPMPGYGDFRPAAKGLQAV